MRDQVSWSNAQHISLQSYRCGYCGDAVASNQRLQGEFRRTNPGAFLAVCPRCSFPNFIRTGRQTPDVRSGNEVTGVDEKSVLDLYNEARDCTAVGAHAAAVLCCRKFLMHVAVAKGASEGKKFVEYVDHLAATGYIPPDGRKWVDHVRKVGEATNEKHDG